MVQIKLALQLHWSVCELHFKLNLINNNDNHKEHQELKLIQAHH